MEQLLGCLSGSTHTTDQVPNVFSVFSAACAFTVVAIARSVTPAMTPNNRRLQPKARPQSFFADGCTMQKTPHNFGWNSIYSLAHKGRQQAPAFMMLAAGLPGAVSIEYAIEESGECVNIS